MDISQAKVTTLEPVGEPGMVEAQQVQQRGLDIMDTHRVLDHVEAQVVGGAMRYAGFQPAF